jgi:glutathione-regulated potassium-efflux system ancillary protein KefC/glutathione-regulated potassium-efflux system protein KefB
MLEQLTLFLAAAVLIVPLFKKLGLGTVLGYLVAGMLLGPWGLHLVTDVESILHISELGVVLLLFVIGLELQPSRLWVLRRTVFGLGSAQVVGCTLLIGAVAAVGFAQHWLAAGVIGFGLAMSSTAYVLQTLAERDELTARHGRESFAILLFQDLAIIPALAALPLLAYSPETRTGAIDWLELLRAIVVLVGMVVAGRQLLRWAFRLIARFGNRELFTATALLVAIGTALLMAYLDLSMSLGAFLAGVLLADSEFRHEIEAVLEPFKGLLLGLFFIAVGMSVNLGVVAQLPAALAAAALALCVVKFLVIFAVARAAGARTESARNLGIALAAGGEFAFVLFNLARDYRIIDNAMADKLLATVVLSMMLAPVLFIVNDRLVKPWLSAKAEPEFDRIDEPGNAVVIAGFGRVGQIVARILRMRGIPFTALDSSPTQVDFVRKFGSKIYYGDASRLELLRAAKVDQARLFVLAVGNIDASLKIAQTVRRHFPGIPIYARAHNRFHSYKLRDVGVHFLMRDTILSSLALAREVLAGLGVPPATAADSVEKFRVFDEALLARQHAIYQDESALIESAKQSAEELRGLFEADQNEAPG